MEEWQEVLDYKSNKFYYHLKGDTTVRWAIPNSDWRKFLDAKSGKPYYCNVKTSEILWKLPTGLVVPSSTSVEAPLPPRTSLAPQPPPQATTHTSELVTVAESPDQEVSSSEVPPTDAPPMDAPPMDAPPMDAPPMDAPPVEQAPSLDEGPPPAPGPGPGPTSNGGKEKKKWKIESVQEEPMWKDKYPFHAAAQGGDVVSLCRILNDKGDKAKDLIDELDGEDHWSALQYACWEGHKSVVVELIKRGANVSLPNTNGSTALHYAAGVGRLQIVRKLLKHGADKNALDKEKRTPLKLAQELKPQNWEAIVEILGEV